MIKKLFLLLLFAMPCFGASTILNAFNSGELSPLLDGRTDVQKYYSGCKTLENFLVLSYGGVERRPGTKYIASVKTASSKTRLIPFEYSVDDSYILEFGDEYIRFYRNGGQIQEIETGASSEDLADLTSLWVNCVLYLKCNDSAANTIVDDSSTSNNDGNSVANTSTLTTTGEVNEALTFNGSTDYITVDDESSLDFGTGNFTVSFWMNTTYYGNTQFLFYKHDGPTVQSDEGFNIYYYYGRIGSQITDTSGNSKYQSGPTRLDDGSWHHVVVIFDRSTDFMTCYIDRNLDYQKDISSVTGSISNNKALYIGKSYSTYYKYQGSLDIISIFNKALSFTEIGEMFNGTVGLIPYEISTPYIEKDLFNLQFIQSADKIYIVYPFYAPRILSRTGHTAWTLTQFESENGPFLDENTDATITITPPASPTDVTASQTFSASDIITGYEASKAFDNVITGTNGWATDGGNVTNQWVRVQFGTAKTITKIKMLPCLNTANLYVQPKYFEIQASNNGSSWTTLTPNMWRGRCEANGVTGIYADITGNYTDWLEIGLTNTAAYTYYQIWIDQNWGDATTIGIKEIEMMEAGSDVYTASSSLWNANHVGSQWKLTHARTTNQITNSFGTPGGWWSNSIDVKGTWDFITHGTWTASIEIQRSYDNGATWQTYRSFSGANDYNPNVSAEETDNNVRYRVKCTSYTSGTCNYSFSVREGQKSGVITITGYTNGTSVTADVNVELGGTAATNKWSEGAWSIDEGYPSTVAFYEERMVFGGTTNKPQTLWFSKTGDWTNFETGDLDADAMTYTIASDKMDAIRWLSSQSSLLIGTAGGEWRISGSSADAGLTPTNVSVRRQSSYGSSYIKPQIINNVTLFIQRQGRKIRELVYSFTDDAWVAPDMTVLSEHVTKTGIVQMALQNTPDPILWCVRTDGDLIGMTYQREQDVIAWHRHIFDGDVESVAVIPGSTEDEVWLIVKRTIDDSEVRYIEQFQPRGWTDEKQAFYVDSGLSWYGGAEISVTDINVNFITGKATVTAAAHGYTNGWYAKFEDVGGMTEVNGETYIVSDAATNTFILKDVNSAYVDANDFTEYTSGGRVMRVAKSFLSLDHLEGESVVAVGDGNYVGTAVVAANSVTLSDYYNRVHIGLPYTSKLQTMRLELPGSATLQGRVKRINSVTLRLYNTLAAKIGPSWSKLDSVNLKNIYDESQTEAALFSGDRKIDFKGDYDTDAHIYIEQDLPLPFTLLCLIPELEIYK